jgi:transcriptional regulator with XRE-family HTH domain
MRAANDPRKSPDGEALQAAVTDRLRVAKAAKGIQQDELALKVGLSRAMISDIFRGAHLASLPQIEALSRALGVRFAWLATGDGVMVDERPPKESLLETARKLESLGVNYLGACLAMMPTVPPSKAAWEAALHATTAHYVVCAPHGMSDPDMAFVLDLIVERCGLSLLEVLDGFEPSHRIAHFLELFRNRGIDPEAFMWGWEGGLAGPLRYRVERARGVEALVAETLGLPSGCVDDGLHAAVEDALGHFRPILPSPS